ncbi:hypothetical protein [Roseateles violae]|uniref:Uncharacterized protein n=1 Tax=Roseateles violae TaxID=3058042 RepID=A0ABT8DYB5_9BURK|nr:hypothetical protein [Pelomonas sp. PFR6]MDN3922442.1 hypothetical protein [Pelomonas sp. PFR6]
MTRQARSTSSTPNPDFRALKRKRGQGNVDWCERVRREMREATPEQWSLIALIGGADTLSFRLRIAQSHLRPDMQPSYWSEALLLVPEGAALAGARAIHVPLMQPDGPEYGPKSNGVVSTPLTAFDDAQRYPNIALIALPLPQARVLARVDAFMSSRSTLDTLEHVLRWLAFSWGVAKTGNPLHENYGLPSACMLETVCAAEEFDLTPGLESRASCPEAIWSAARHWHDYFIKTGGQKPFGRYAIDHAYPIMESARTALPAAPQAKAAAKSAAKAGRRR